MLDKINSLKISRYISTLFSKLNWKSLNSGFLHYFEKLTDTLFDPPLRNSIIFSRRLSAASLILQTPRARAGLVPGEVFVQPNFDAALLVDADHVFIWLQRSKEGIKGVIASGSRRKDVQSLLKAETSVVLAQSADDVLNQNVRCPGL